ncbi:MAG: hypothetical protein Q3963_06115 [Coriobacteriaceae bacterium]|nr:hypothetical protein [Coriobacteriaceae bacterium]
MRKTTTFEGKRRIFDTAKAEALGNRAYSYYGDPAGYEETLFKTKGGLYFLHGIGGAESPYPAGEDIVPITEAEANAWLAD